MVYKRLCVDTCYGYDVGSETVDEILQTVVFNRVD